MSAFNDNSPFASHQRIDESNSETADSSWRSLYIMGGAGVMISVLLVLLDFFVSILLPRGVVEPGARSAIDWFTLFQDNTYYRLRELGFLSMLTLVLGIPVSLALYAAHRRVHKAYAFLVATGAVAWYMHKAFRGGAANFPAVPIHPSNPIPANPLRTGYGKDKEAQ